MNQQEFAARVGISQAYMEHVKGEIGAASAATTWHVYRSLQKFRACSKALLTSAHDRQV